MSTLGHDANAFTNRLQRMRSAGVRINLAGLLEGTSLDDDRLVADWIRSYGDAVRAEAIGVCLEEFVTAAPWLLDSEEALDAAIEVCLDSAAARHESLDAAAAGMVRAYPGIAPAIRRAVLLHVSLRPSEDGAMPTGAAVFTLPHDFGAPGPGGRARYELRGLIGVGGQGVVYSAIDRLFSEPQAPTYVAVKVFHGTGSGATGSHDSSARGEAIRAAASPIRGSCGRSTTASTGRPTPTPHSNSSRAGRSING